MKDAPLTENPGKSSSEMDEHSGMEQIAHVAGELLNVAEKGRHVMGKHVPGILGPITKAVEMGVEIMAQHSEDPVANVVCGVVTGAAKITTGVATMAVTVNAFRAAPQIVAPLVTTAIAEAVVTGGLGFAAHHVFDPIVMPVGDAVNRVCHRTVALVREATNIPCDNHAPRVSDEDGIKPAQQRTQTPMRAAKSVSREQQGQAQHASLGHATTQQSTEKMTMFKATRTIDKTIRAEEAAQVDAAAQRGHLSSTDQAAYRHARRTAEAQAVSEASRQGQLSATDQAAYEASQARTKPPQSSAKPASSVTTRTEKVPAAGHAGHQAAPNAKAGNKSSISPVKKNQRTRMPSRTKLSEGHEQIRNYAEELFADEGISLDEIAQKMQTAMQSPLNDLSERIKHQPAPDNREAVKKFSSVCDDVAGVAYLGSTIANLLGDKKKAAAFSQISTGAAMTGMAATALATSGFSIGAGALLLTGLLQTTGGLADLFGEEDDAGPNPMMLMLEQLAMGLAKISQQIIQLGKYIESRFDELKQIIGSNHKDAMQFMRQCWFTQVLSDDQLKKILRENFSRVDQQLQRLQITLDQMQEKAIRDVEIRISDRIAQMQEFHYLQTLLDRRLVNEVETVMQRPDELLQRVADYSRQLMQSIKTECRGSQTLTGGDLPVNFSNLSSTQLELLRSRWLYKAQGLATHSVYATAAYQIDALMAFAQQQQAVPSGVAVTPLPNLVLLTDRARSFSKLLRTYAEQTKNTAISDPNAPIIVPLSVKRDVEEVLAVLQTSIQLLRNIESKKIVEKGLDAMKSQITAIQNEAGKALVEFKQQKISECMTRRVTRLEQLRELLQAVPPLPKVVIPEQNKVFSYTLRPMNLMTYGILNNDDNILRASLQEHSGQFLNVITSPHWSISETIWIGGYDATWRHDIQHSPWHAAGLALFQEKLKTWKPTHASVVKRLSLADHVVGSEGYENTQTMARVRTRTQERDQSFINTIQASQQIKPVEEEPGFSLYGEQFFTNLTINGADSWKRACTLGPRIVLPATGETIKFPLYLHDSGFDKFIPQSALLAEDMGLGELDLRYEIKVEKIDANAQKLKFNLRMQFIPKNQPSSSILLFNQEISCDVSTVYDNMEDAVWRCFYKEPVFTGERVDLSCDLFDHTNPFFKRKSYDLQSQFAAFEVLSSTFNAAKTALNKLVENGRVQWRNDFNAKIKQQVKGYEGKIGTHLIQADSLLMMTRCWLRLLTPTVYEASQEALLKTLEVIGQVEQYVDTFDAKNYNGTNYGSPPAIPFVRSLLNVFTRCINQIATAKTQLVVSLAEEINPGDKDLVALYDGLIALQTRLVIEEPKDQRSLDSEQESEVIQAMREQVAQLQRIVTELTARQAAVVQVDEDAQAEYTDDDEAEELEDLTRDYFALHALGNEEEERLLWKKPEAPFDQPGKRILNGNYFHGKGQRPAFFRHLTNEKHLSAKQKVIDGETTIVVQLSTVQP